MIILSSDSTSYGTSASTTTPTGKESIDSKSHKKNMIGIALAHDLKYVTQTVASFPEDIENKGKLYSNTYTLYSWMEIK